MLSYLYMEVLFYIILFLLGAAMGSFLCCQAWRFRLLQKGKKLGKRSVCISCHKQLKWYDNIPIISWLLLRGKCRFCKKKIGIAEFLAEVLSGIAFVGIGSLFSIDSTDALSWAYFVVLLLLALMLIFLGIYDGKWGELPVVFLIVAIVIGLVAWVIKGFLIGFSLEYFLQTGGALLILAGLYLLLYLASKGKWVGDGDYILCIALALGLANSWLALVTLFLANMIGCIVMLPQKQKKIYFGPFLVAAFLIALVFQEFLLNLICFK